MLRQFMAAGDLLSYSDRQLSDQLSGWVEQGIRQVKIKIGRDANRDVERVRVARKAISPETELYVDANGAYSRKQALMQAERFAPFGVTWFEEPVSSDDLDGLRILRDRAPSGMEIAAGEYGYDIFYFRNMLSAGAVDVQQADVTRCGGITGFLQVAALCQAHNIPLSAHTAPALHTHVACAVNPFKNLEYFHDHVRIEAMLFDGLPQLVHGELCPICRAQETGSNSSELTQNDLPPKGEMMSASKIPLVTIDDLKKSIASRPPDWRSRGGRGCPASKLTCAETSKARCVLMPVQKQCMRWTPAITGRCRLEW